MSIRQFLNLGLTGDRFEGHAIPLEFLKDLPVLNEMIIEVAKLKFFEDHPDRKRSPRGFTHGIELKLTQIGEGSATLNIDLVTSTNTFLPTTSQTYFETARDTVVDAIRIAEHNEQFAGRIPDKMLSYFDRFGRSLRDGEAIEFTTPTRTNPAKLTKEIRQRLVLGSPAIRELTEETSTWGAVPEADQVAMTFEIQVLDRSRIKAPIAPQHFDIVVEAFKGYKEGARFRFEGIGRFSRDSRHLAFDSIEHITALDPLDVPARLDEFRGMKDGGWKEAGSPLRVPDWTGWPPASSAATPMMSPCLTRTRPLRAACGLSGRSGRMPSSSISICMNIAPTGSGSTETPVPSRRRG